MRCQWQVLEYFPQNTGFYPSLDRIVETMLRPLNLGPGGRSYNKPISCLHWFPQIQGGGPKEPDLAQLLGWALSHQVSDSLMDRFMGVLMMRFKLREGSSLSVGNYIQDWGGHESDFHNVTQYGSKMCHATVTGVTCDTTRRKL